MIFEGQAVKVSVDDAGVANGHSGFWSRES